MWIWGGKHDVVIYHISLMLLGTQTRINKPDYGHIVHFNIHNSVIKLTNAFFSVVRLSLEALGNSCT